MLIYIIIATLIVSLISLIGISIFLKKKYTQKFMEATISLAAAVLLGNVFFHLFPEIVELYETNGNIDFQIISLWILGSIIFFFLTEKYLHWHHCQDHDHGKNCIHPMGYNVLIGDGLHNFIDGIVIATSFMLDVRIGIMATIAIALHEIPQEISDFSLLLHAGFSKAKALFWNLMSALSAVIGGILAYFYIQTAEHQLFLTALAAGSFLYIAMADIMPHLHGEKNKHHIHQLIWFVIGLLIMYYSNKILNF